MLRFHLFNNTFVKITLKDSPSEGYSITEAQNKIEELIRKIKDPIKVERLPKIYECKFNFKTLNNHFEYNKLLKEMSFVDEQT